MEAKSYISAKIIADSANPFNGKRITTMLLKMPRFILAQFNTHRAFSRNTASSRAVPVQRMIARVKAEPYIPFAWGKNQAGMQADSNINEADAKKAASLWNDSMECALVVADELGVIGVHKQLANRILEPFMYVETIVTATEWDNFFNLRLNHDAQPEMQELAAKMKKALDESAPTLSYLHLPFVNEEEVLHKIKKLNANIPVMLNAEKMFELVEIFNTYGMVSAARCARVSYLNHDGSTPDLEADMALGKKLQESGHLSPFEHSALAQADINGASNIKYWNTSRFVQEQAAKLHTTFTSGAKEAVANLFKCECKPEPESAQTISFSESDLEAIMQNVTDPLSDTLMWFEAAVPNPALKNISVQIGCHIEEFTEMCETMGAGYELIENLMINSSMFKTNENFNTMEQGLCNQESLSKLTDALADQFVTSIGCLYMLHGSGDTIRILQEVVRSNNSKFENGKPVFNENGKITKGKDYTPPDFSKFTGRIAKGKHYGMGS